VTSSTSAAWISGFGRSRSAAPPLRKLLVKDDLKRCIQFSGHEGDGSPSFGRPMPWGAGDCVQARGQLLPQQPLQSLAEDQVDDGERVGCGLDGGKPGRRAFALLAREGKEGVYAGSAFVTLGAADRDRFWTTTEALRVPKVVVSDLRKDKRKTSFVRPELRVHARHLKGACSATRG